MLVRGYGMISPLLHALMCTHTVSAFAIWGFEGVQLSKSQFLPHAGMATALFLYSVCGPFYTDASYIQKKKTPIRKKIKDFAWKIFEKENPVANVLFK